MATSDVKKGLEIIQNEYRTFIAEQERYDDTAIESDEEDQSEDTSAYVSSNSNLASIPESQWAAIRVSQCSLFGYEKWNFENEGSPLYVGQASFDFDQALTATVRLTDEECKPLYRFIKALVFYLLPQNACMNTVRSYNTTVITASSLMQLARLLYNHGIFIDRHGNGSYLTAEHLTQQDIHNYIETELTSHYSRYTLACNIKLWQNLSTANYLPSHYRLHKELVSKKQLAGLLKQREEAKGTFMPISLEALSIAVPYCVDLINKYTEDIMYAYEVLHPIFMGVKARKQTEFSWGKVLTALTKRKTDLWDMDIFRNEEGTLTAEQHSYIMRQISKYPNWREHVESRHVRRIEELSNKEKIRLAKKLGVDLNIDSGAIFYDLIRIIRHFVTIFSTFRNACAVIILLVTGMRRSEYLHIEEGQSYEVPGMPNEYRLRFLVFKTSDYSQGEWIVLPIPDIAYKALKALERLTLRARLYGGTNKLSVNHTNGFGKPLSRSRVNAFLIDLWKFLGIDEHIHPHMFRKTLAMFAIYQDARNINVIKRLFNHRSLAQTFAYIVQMPGMAEEIKLSIFDMNMDLLVEVLDAAQKERIGGKCGLRIKDQLKTNKFFARLNDDGQESLRQYIDSLLESNVRLLHRCSMNAICTNTHESVTIDHEACNCEVVNCDYPVFTDKSLPDINETVRFHEQWLKHPNISDAQEKFSKRIIKECLARLEEIQGNEETMAQYPKHYGLTV